MGFVPVEKKLLGGCENGILLWYPFAELECLDEPEWCYLVDCFAAALLGPAARLLLSRRVRCLATVSEPPVEAPVLTPLSCGEEVARALSPPGGSGEAAATAATARADYADYMAARLLGSKQALRKIEDYFRGFVDAARILRGLASEVKPERLRYVGVVHVLACVDRRGRIHFLIGGERLRSPLHERYVLGEERVRRELEAVLGKRLPRPIA